MIIKLTQKTNMKYIILPITKFLFALFLSIIFVIVAFWYLLIHCLWNWEFNFKEILMFKFSRNDDMNISPYFEPEYYRDYYFKSHFHYYWNISNFQSRDSLMLDYEINRITKDKFIPKKIKKENIENLNFKKRKTRFYEDKVSRKIFMIEHKLRTDSTILEIEKLLIKKEKDELVELLLHCYIHSQPALCMSPIWKEHCQIIKDNYKNEKKI